MLPLRVYEGGTLQLKDETSKMRDMTAVDSMEKKNFVPVSSLMMGASPASTSEKQRRKFNVLNYKGDQKHGNRHLT